MRPGPSAMFNWKQSRTEPEFREARRARVVVFVLFTSLKIEMSSSRAALIGQRCRHPASSDWLEARYRAEWDACALDWFRMIFWMLKKKYSWLIQIQIFMCSNNSIPVENSRRFPLNQPKMHKCTATQRSVVVGHVFTASCACVGGEAREWKNAIREEERRVADCKSRLSRCGVCGDLVRWSDDPWRGVRMSLPNNNRALVWRWIFTLQRMAGEANSKTITIQMRNARDSSRCWCVVVLLCY